MNARTHPFVSSPALGNSLGTPLGKPFLFEMHNRCSFPFFLFFFLFLFPVALWNTEVSLHAFDRVWRRSLRPESEKSWRARSFVSLPAPSDEFHPLILCHLLAILVRFAIVKVSRCFEVLRGQTASLFLSLFVARKSASKGKIFASAGIVRLEPRREERPRGYGGPGGKIFIVTPPKRLPRLRRAYVQRN